MRIFIINFIITLLPLFTVLATNSDYLHVLQTEPQFNPTGHYYFPSEPPRGFENMGAITITTAELQPTPGQSLHWVAIPPQGVVRANGRIYKMILIRLEGNALYFRTESIKGISYQFNGCFLERGVFYTIDPGLRVVLKGRLIKTRKVRRIAGSEVGFIWFGRI